MKILLVNKFLYPKGGAETYVFKLGQMLQAGGHEVQYFGLENGKNIVGNRAGAYVSDLDFSKGIRGNLTAPFRIVYCAEARRKIRSVLEDFQPDVVHVNNIQYHLTPSILLETQRYRKKAGRPVKLVYTAHDYQLICPSHGLYDNDLRPCEKCLGGNYTHCLRTKCLKNSYLKSFLGMLDGYWWKYSKAYSYIDAIVCPSRFLKSKLDVQPRFAAKTLVLQNFMEEDWGEPVEKQDYVLEFGRLSREKGTLTLLEAARNMPDTRFVFAGYGPETEAVKALPNGEYVGFLTGEELRKLVAAAAVSVYPSQWYENCPYSVMESQRLGTPVIGARIGGIPELIQEGQTGELFAPGDARELEEKLRSLLADPQRMERYGKQGRMLAVETPERYLEKLMEIYRR